MFRVLPCVDVVGPTKAIESTGIGFCYSAAGEAPAPERPTRPYPRGSAAVAARSRYRCPEEPIDPDQCLFTFVSDPTVTKGH